MEPAQFRQFMGLCEKMVQGNNSGGAKRLGQSREFLRIGKYGKGGGGNRKGLENGLEIFKLL